MKELVSDELRRDAGSSLLVCVKAHKLVTKLIAARLQAGAETDSTSSLICYSGGEIEKKKLNKI